MYDLLLNSLKKSQSSKILSDLDIAPRSYLLATIHRPENTDNKKNLLNIVEAFIKSKEKIIFPAHFRTVKYLKKHGLYGKLSRSKNVTILKPIGYLDFLNLMANSNKILTDSGGIQKESYILKVPCITLRENTEWVETVSDTWNVLVGAKVNKITDAIRNFKPKKPTKKLFGDGKARIKIRKILSKKI
jgi:UDP-N-acetylglucosamine 2-epimerase (non-hydrolysing)